MPAVRIIAAASTTATALALAPSAHAAVITPPCIRTSPSVAVQQPVVGSGFTPGALVTVRTSTKNSPTPVYLTSATADAAGNFTASASPPSFNPFSRKLQTFNLGAFDGANPALVAVTTFQRVEVGYTTNPTSGRPTTRALHTVRGFATGKNVYLHFRYQGKTKRNVKLGKAKGVCGVVSKRMALLPTRSHPGKWTAYADQKRTYHKTTKPQLKVSFTITRTFG